MSYVNSLSIILPCFNEESSILTTLKRVENHILNNIKLVRFNIIVVDDGSTDSTKLIVNNYIKESSNTKLISFPYNKGRGAAMKAGLASVTTEFLIFLDSDLSYDVEHISEVVNYFNKNPNTDAIILSPYMKDGQAKNIPFFRLCLSRSANWILSGFFSSEISTVTSMARAYRTNVIQNIILIEDGKELHLEILRKLHLVSANISEIPGRLIWKEKKNRGQRLNKKKVAKSAKKHLLYGFLAKPTRLIGKVSILILLVSLWEIKNLFIVFLSFYSPGEQWYGKDLWHALNETFFSSPHTVIIAVVGLIITIQAFSYLSLFSVLTMQHEELLQHILKTSTNKDE